MDTTGSWGSNGEMLLIILRLKNHNMLVTYATVAFPSSGKHRVTCGQGTFYREEYYCEVVRKHRRSAHELKLPSEL